MPRTLLRQSLRLGLPLWLLIVCAALPGEAAPPAKAAPPSPAQAASRLQQVEKQIEAHKAKIEAARIKALNLEQELHRIDSQIKKGQATLRELQGKLRRQEGHIRQKESEVAAIQGRKDALADHVTKRLAAFYQTGEVGIINALFSAEDLGDLLNLQEYVQALFKYDQQALQGFRNQISMVVKAKDELTKAREELQALIRQVQESEKSLLKSREERNTLLEQARAEEELYKQALKELKATAEKLTKTIDQYRAQEIAKNKEKAAKQASSSPPPAVSPGTGFAAQQGKIPPPAAGRIVRRFGPYKDIFGNDLNSQGLDLAVPPQTTVKAMHGGRVIFSDQMPGYGRLVIVDHGGQYYSLVAGLASLSKKKNDEVRAGEPLGTFDKPTGLINPGLHIEIRHGATPVDPLLWLDRAQLKDSDGRDND